MLFLKESRSGPPSIPLVPPEKNQPDPGGRQRASWSLSLYIEGEQTMKTLIGSVLVLALSFPVAGQRIDTQRADRKLVRRVETMANHLTVIECSEPVVMAAAGSPSFKIERQGNKVLIQPIEEDATTNLFIWTASGRFSYELVPATSMATADFAIDQQSYPSEKIEPRAANKEPGPAGPPIRR